MKQFAVFDIDGTLIRWQLYHAVVNECLKHGFISEMGRSRINDAMKRWKERETDDAFKYYETTLIAVFESILSSLSMVDFDNTVDAVVEKYKRQTYTYTRNLIYDLKEKNYTLLAISGSHQELVDHVAQFYGFDHYVGSIYERQGNSFTGKRTIASLDKAKILKRLVSDNNLTYDGSFGVGDSHSDISMLTIVEHPIAFNPDKKLYSTARRKHWKIVVERKNVIYELEDKHGEYLLV